MPIINTMHKANLKFLAFLLILLSLVGCSKDNNQGKAEDYAQQSQAYYQCAIEAYKTAINSGKDLDRLYFEIGRLYFEHGDITNAIMALEKAPESRAKKFLAQAYFREGRFTDALEIFNKYDIQEDDYLYYRGLTCEKLNLFDEALESYDKIRGKEFLRLASGRIRNIENRDAVGNHIKGVDQRASEILLSAPPAEKYPQAGALILSCDENIEITSGGTQISSLHYIIKILNERGKENFSETEIDYDSTTEKIELEYARTIKPDGTVIEVGARHIRDVSKYLNFPLYSNVRAYIISFPEITQGAVIEYKLKVYNNRLINKKDFALTYPVQASEPVISARFSITLPKETGLRIKALNEKYNNFGAHLEPDIKTGVASLVYSWNFRDVPQLLPESGMPPDSEVNPTLIFSTFDSWQEVYDWWQGLSSDKTKADRFIKDKVRELTLAGKTAEEKARSIYNFCAQQIRYVAVEYGQAGYEPHKAEDIFKNKYGDCKDQAILLVTMLKEAGLTAWPVLIATKNAYNLETDFPSVIFNHCIAAVSIGDQTVFLDPTAETCSFGDLPTDDQKRRVLIFKPEAYKIADTPFFNAQHNLVKHTLKIKVANDGSIIAEKEVSTFGIYDQAQRFWLLYTPPELIEDSLQEAIQEVSIGATLDAYDIKNLKDLNAPILLDYKFRGREYFTLAGNLMISPQLVGLDTSLVAKDRRRYPLDFVNLDSKETVTEIAIPGDFVIKYMPQSLYEDSPWLKFSVEYSDKNRTLYCRQKTELKKSTVSETEYPEFKKFFEDLAKKAKQRIVLEKEK